MHLSDYDYDLPEELIARFPAAERRGSRLLVVDADDGSLHDRHFAELPGLLRSGDLLVLNNTQVIKARLRGHKDSGGKAEILIERVIGENEALALVKASKTPRAGTVLRFDEDCSAEVLGREDSLFRLRFNLPVDTAMSRHGEVPLPPYLEREAEDADLDRYQTVYAASPGAVAAPTAGLHFDTDLFGELSNAGIEHCFVTLHVGAGTFQNLRHETVEDNQLHMERYEVSPETAERVNKTRAAGGRIVAVGTTSVRTLEAAADNGRLMPGSGETDLFIHPGYRFQLVDVMLTNFHLPRSSLLLLVSAFAGRERMLDAYRHAVESAYRFFSYGDAMLITPGGSGR